jgi:hypothetical protein
MTLFGVQPTTTLAVCPNRLDLSTLSLAGFTRCIVPLENISSTYYGYFKPWKEALVLLIVLGAIATGVIQPLASAITRHGTLTAIGVILLTYALCIVVVVLYYVFNRTFTLGVVEKSGVSHAISFKRSAVENVDVTMEAAAFAGEVMQALVEAKHNRYMS